MAAIFGKRKIFWKLQRVHFLDTLWVENFNEITLFCTVKEIESILCFAILGKNSKIQNGRHMWEEENFWKLQKVHCSDTLWVESMDEIALSRMVKEIEANFVFCHFWQKFENSKWPPFLGRRKFFWKLLRVHFWDNLWVENFDEIALSRTVKEIEAILCFAIFGKNSKIQNGCHFGGGENILKLPRVHCLDTLWVENFDEIALSHAVKEIEANSKWEKFENSKWPPFLGRGKFFWKLQRVHSLDTLWIENFDEITLSRTVKEIEGNLCFAIFGKVAK